MHGDLELSKCECEIEGGAGKWNSPSRSVGQRWAGNSAARLPSKIVHVGSRGPRAGNENSERTAGNTRLQVRQTHLLSSEAGKVLE